MPGIYSLSPYSLEEVVNTTSKDPDVILNIVDGSNLERNLYLTTQLTELGIPVYCPHIDGCRSKATKSTWLNYLGNWVVNCRNVSLRGEGVKEAAEVAVAEAKPATQSYAQVFGNSEHALAHIEEATLHHLPEERAWYAIKIFELTSGSLKVSILMLKR